MRTDFYNRISFAKIANPNVARIAIRRRRYNNRMHFLRVVESIAAAVNENAGRALSWLLPLMTAMTLGIIAASAFRVGRVWLGESVVYMHAILFMSAAAYTLRHDGHVRIDVIYGRLSETGRAWVNLLGALFLLAPTCAVIAVYAFPYIAASWAVREHSPEGGGLPAVFLLKTCILLFAATMILEGLAMAAKSLSVILSRR